MVIILPFSFVLLITYNSFPYLEEMAWGFRGRIRQQTLIPQEVVAIAIALNLMKYSLQMATAGRQMEKPINTEEK